MGASNCLRLGKRIGRIGFVIGFLGPLFFYASPAQFPTYESHLVCPWCPYVDVAYATWLTWVEVGLKFGLLSGLLLALIGFLVGYTVSRVAGSN